MFVLSISFFPVHAQQVALQLDRMNVLTLAESNPLSVVASDGPSSGLMMTTSNGQITKDALPGHFHIIPEHLGIAIVTVSRKTKAGIKKIKEINYRVKNAPLTIRLDKEGRLPALQLYRSAGLYQLTEIKCNDQIVDSCSYTISRHDAAIFRKSIRDIYASYDQDTRAFFKTLHDGDKLSIQVTTQPVGNGYPHLRTLDFIICDTEAMRKELSRVFVIDPVTGVETEVK